MKNKILVLILMIGCLGFISGCGNQLIDETVDGTLEDIMSKLYDGIAEENLPMGLTNIEVNEENIEGFLGTSDIEYKEAIASESMVGSIAHSVVLLRAKDEKNVEKLKTTIRENVNPRKWVCVGVDEDEVIVDNKGDLVILILINDETTRSKIEKSFKNL